MTTGMLIGIAFALGALCGAGCFALGAACGGARRGADGAGEALGAAEALSDAEFAQYLKLLEYDAGLAGTQQNEPD